MTRQTTHERSFVVDEAYPDHNPDRHLSSSDVLGMMTVAVLCPLDRNNKTLDSHI